MKRILIIDDDPGIQDLLRKTLTLKEYDVVCVSDGKEGLEKFNSDIFDLVITDIFMPEKDGFEIIKEICIKDSGMKIIAISGGANFAFEESMSIATHLGADHFLEKPFQIKKIISVVEELIG
jgi:DNA-binding response OmpR family regulator